METAMVEKTNKTLQLLFAMLDDGSHLVRVSQAGVDHRGEAEHVFCARF